MILRRIVFGFILLGIVYNLALPFTPVWLDITVWSGVAVAFVIAAALNRKKKEACEDTSS